MEGTRWGRGAAHFSPAFARALAGVQVVGAEAQRKVGRVEREVHAGRAAPPIESKERGEPVLGECWDEISSAKEQAADDEGAEEGGKCGPALARQHKGITPSTTIVMWTRRVE